MNLASMMESRPFDELPDIRDLLIRPWWHAEAACRGTDAIFFVDRGESAEPAKAICSTCPVVDECRDFALDSGEKHGIWGGTSERERRVLRKNRAA